MLLFVSLKSMFLVTPAKTWSNHAMLAGLRHNTLAELLPGERILRPEMKPAYLLVEWKFQALNRRGKRYKASEELSVPFAAVSLVEPRFKWKTSFVSCRHFPR